MKHAYLFLLCVPLFFGACTDKIINNYYGSDTGIISGRIYPVDAGTMITLSPGGLSAGVDYAGRFIIGQVPVGMYDVAIRPSEYSPRRFFQVIVSPGQVADLGKVELSTYPYPVYRTLPADGEDSVSTRTQILLYTDEPLDIGSLNANYQIHPPLDGSWTESQKGNGYAYSFVQDPRTALRIGMTYTITLLENVRTAAGASLGQTASFQFTTTPLEIYVSLPYAGVTGRTPIHNFRPRLMFPESVYRDSVAAAVRFEPAISGEWVTYVRPPNFDDDFGDSFYFVPVEQMLPPSTPYRLIIDASVIFNDDGLRLSTPDTTEFVTEAYGLTRVYPIPGAFTTYVNQVHLEFNVPMDTGSVRAAFSLRDAVEAPVSGTVAWSLDDRVMDFIPESTLGYGVYHLALSGDALLATGEPIGTDFRTYFVVTQ